MNKKRHYNMGGGISNLSTGRLSQMDKVRNLSSVLDNRAEKSLRRMSSGLGSDMAKGGPIPGYRNGGPTRFGLDEESVRMREFRNPPKHGISPHRVPPKFEVWDREQIRRTKDFLKNLLPNLGKGVGSLFKAVNRLTPKATPLGVLGELLSPRELGPGTLEEMSPEQREAYEEYQLEKKFERPWIRDISGELRRYTGTGNELGPLSLYGGGLIPGYQAGGGWGQTEATPPGSAPGITPPPNPPTGQWGQMGPNPPGGGAQAVPPPPGGTGGGGWGGPQAVPPPPGGAQPFGGGLATPSSGYASGVQPLAGGSWSKPAQTLGGPPMDTSAGIPWSGPGARPADYDPQQAAEEAARRKGHYETKSRLDKQFREQLKRWKEEGGGPFAASPPGGGGGLGGLGGLGQQQQFSPQPARGPSPTPGMTQGPDIDVVGTAPYEQYQGPGLMAQQAATPGAQYYNPTQSGPGYQADPLPEDYGAPMEYAGFGAPGQMTVRQEHVAPELAAPMADLTQSIMDIGTTPYEQYQGPRLAGFSPDEAAAQAAFGAYGRGQGPMGTRQAAGTLGEVGRGLGSMVGRAEAGALDPYMSQYMEGVVDPQLSKLQEFSRQQGEELKSRAAGATGGIGGLREGVVRRGQLQDVRQQAADIIGQGQQRAFESAQQAFGQAHAERLGQLGALSGVAGQQRGLGQQQQQQQLERLQQMQQAGADQRQLQQAGLDVGWEEFQRRQQYPQRQTSWMAQQLASLPYRSTVSEGIYTPQGGPVSSAIGSGLAGIGAAQQYRQQQEDAAYRRAKTERMERENEAARAAEAAKQEGPPLSTGSTESSTGSPWDNW